MKKIFPIAFSSLLILGACSGGAKKTADNDSSTDSLKTFVYNGNPLIRDKFTADPAPMVHDGRLYLYVGHDEYYEGQDTASGGKEFNITEFAIQQTT